MSKSPGKRDGYRESNKTRRKYDGKLRGEDERRAPRVWTEEKQHGLARGWHELNRRRGS